MARLQSVIAEDTVSAEYFLRLHICVEALLKRWLFIGLHLKGVQYKTAQTAVRLHHDGIASLLELLPELCGLSYTGLKVSGNYKTLEDLFLNFSAKYRNYMVHGIFGNIGDGETLTLLIKTDKRFICEIQSFIEANGKPSLFAKPGAWGTPKASPATIEEVFQKHLKLKHLKNPPYTIEKVKDLWKGLENGNARKISPMTAAHG